MEQEPVAPTGLGYVPEGYRSPDQARPPRNRLRPLLIGALAVVLVALAGTVGYVLFLRWDGQPVPGDVAITVELSGPDGREPSAAEVAETRRILLTRMADADLTRPTVTGIGTRTLLITAAGEDRDRAVELTAQGNLTIRPVHTVADGEAGEACAPGAPGESPTEQSVRAAVGEETWAAAEKLTTPDLVEPAPFAAFGTLSCAAIAVLPPTMQFAVPSIGCDALAARPPGSLDRAPDLAAACDDEFHRYLLDPPRVTGTGLTGAEAKLDETGNWVVILKFTDAARPVWTELTRELSVGEKQAAITVDNVVISAPTVMAVITEDPQITGSWLAPAAKAFAARINHGALPLHPVVTTVDTVR